MRNFIIVRSLLLSSALSAPYYIALAQQHSNISASSLLGFVIATAVAALISGSLWGKLADTSSKKVLIITGLLTACLGVGLTLASVIWNRLPMFIFIASFFLLAVTHQGVRVGRQTYITDLAQGNTRTQNVAISNSIIGIVILLVGFFSAIISLFSINAIISLLSLSALIGTIVATQLKET